MATGYECYEARKLWAQSIDLQIPSATILYHIKLSPASRTPPGRVDSVIRVSSQTVQLGRIRGLHNPTAGWAAYDGVETVIPTSGRAESDG